MQPATIPWSSKADDSEADGRVRLSGGILRDVDQSPSKITMCHAAAALHLYVRRKTQRRTGVDVAPMLTEIVLRRQEKIT